MGIKTKITIGLVILGVILMCIFAGNLVSFNTAGQMKVIQYPSGKLVAKTDPGFVMQWLGEEYDYTQFATVGFGEKKGEGSADVQGIDVIFNDASRAKISMMARVELPSDPQQLLAIKKRYSRGYDHFLTAGAVPVISNIVKISANLRSSQEAYTTLAQFKTDIETQLKNGQYATKSIEKKIEKVTGDSERVRMTEIICDSNGIPVTTTHDLIRMGCKVSIQELDVPNFDQKTKEMIDRRKQEDLETQLRKQEAIRAEQEAITAKAKGEAKAAEAKAEMEVEKTRAVTEAEKIRDVAKLEKEAAEFTKRKLILEGQGEAEKKRLIMEADGALEIKLKAEVEKTRLWSTALEKIAQSGAKLVPDTYVEGTNGKGQAPNGFNQWMEMMSVNAAKNLSNSK